MDRRSFSKIWVYGLWAWCGLFAAGCDPFSEKSPYDLAVAGNIPMLKLLLEDGLDVNSTYGYQGRTLLYGAVQREDTECAKFLIERGAQVDFEDKNKNTPLFHAVDYGHEQPVTLLLDHRARVDEKNERGITPFFQAVNKNQTRLAEILLQHGADIHFRANNKNTALHIAAQQGHKEMVQLLLTHKARVNAKNETGFTPLYFPEEFSYRDVSALLKKHGARLAKPAPTAARYKKTYQKLLGKGPLRVTRVVKHEGHSLQSAYSIRGDRVAQTLWLKRPFQEWSEKLYAAQVWNVRTGKKMHSTMNLDGTPQGIQFAPDGNLLISSGKEPGVDIWDPVTGRKIREIGDGRGEILGWGTVGSNRYLLIGENKRPSPDSEANLLDRWYPVFKEITGGLEHSVWIYDYQTGELIRELRGHRGQVWQADFSADGQYIASVSSRSFNEFTDLLIWETATGRPVRVQNNLGWLQPIAPFPNGRRLAVSDGDRTLILDMATGQVITQIREGGYYLGLLQDGRYMVCLKYEQLFLVDVESGRVVQKVNFRKDFFKLGRGYAEEENFTSLSISPRGDRFMVTTNHGKLIFFELNNA
ncbi:MAG: ankyrin repeat domain-containing protein [Nitrospinae bacterium]|nr:ankyrin repeat domain-containing protein [Nitrospinota bacterium]